MLGWEDLAPFEAEILLRSIFFFHILWQSFACYLQLGRVWSQRCLYLLGCLSLKDSQRGKLLKLFPQSWDFFFLHYFCFSEMHLFKHSLVCTLENVTPFCTEFFKCKKKKNWAINRYNFLWFCSNNLGELLYCKPRKLTLPDKQSDYIWHDQGFVVRKCSFLRPLTESYSETFSKVFRSYY